MLFPEEDAPYLKEWIVKRIEKTSDADSEVLAEYIIALLKHDGDKASIRRLCEEEIPDFLNEDTVPFLDDVFEAITFKSYRPGAPPPPKRPQAAAHAPQPPAVAPPTRPAQGSVPLTGLRKRGAEKMDVEEAEGEIHDGHSAIGRRATKQARRQARRKARQEEMQQQQQTMYPMPMMFDPQDPMVIEAMAQMSMPYLSYPRLPGGSQPRKRGRCRDFDNKGYCSRGGTCPYDHGTESMMPPSFGEYNPNDGPMALPNPATFPFFPSPRGHDSPRGRGGRKAREVKKGGARAPFSAEGPVHDESRSAIVVENIPEESFSEDTVRKFFSQFGKITQVSMQPYKHLAIVKFDKWAAANAAYRSPKVIFDNRFVKVFWYKDANESIPTSQSNPKFEASEFAGSGHGVEEEEEDMDPEVFQQKQEMAQKQHEQRESKRRSLEQKRQELQQKQQELIAKHREEVTRLNDRLAQENGNGDGKSSSADKLRQKLLALEQEAKILGIDPDAPADFEEPDYSAPYAPRGDGSRGRGRGRGRGGATRGRGGFHGTEDRHAAYAQYSLDNRPRRLAITGVDFSAPEQNEQLRHFLLQLGEFESVEQVPVDEKNGTGPATHVSFQDRKTAERLFVLLHGNSLPGVEGKLELSWLSNSSAAGPSSAAGAAPPAAAAAKSTAVDANEMKGAEEDGVGDAMAGNDSQRGDMEVEYGGGDDDDAW